MTKRQKTIDIEILDNKQETKDNWQWYKRWATKGQNITDKETKDNWQQWPILTDKKTKIIDKVSKDNLHRDKR